MKVQPLLTLKFIEITMPLHLPKFSSSPSRSTFHVSFFALHHASNPRSAITMPPKRSYPAIHSQIPLNSSVEGERRVRRKLSFPHFSRHNTSQPLPLTNNRTNDRSNSALHPRHTSVLSRSSPENRTAPMFSHHVEELGHGLRKGARTRSMHGGHHMLLRGRGSSMEGRSAGLPSAILQSTVNDNTERKSNGSIRVGAHVAPTCEIARIPNNGRSEPRLSLNGRARETGAVRPAELVGTRRRKRRARDVDAVMENERSSRGATKNLSERRHVGDGSVLEHMRNLNPVQLHGDGLQKSYFSPRASTSHRDIVVRRLGSTTSERRRLLQRIMNTTVAQSGSNDNVVSNCYPRPPARLTGTGAEQRTSTVVERVSTSGRVPSSRSRGSNAVAICTGPNSNTSSSSNSLPCSPLLNTRIRAGMPRQSASVSSAVDRLHRGSTESLVSIAEGQKSLDRRSRRLRLFRRRGNMRRLSPTELSMQEENSVPDEEVAVLSHTRNSTRRKRINREMGRFHQIGTIKLWPDSQHSELGIMLQGEKVPNTEVIDVDAITSSESSGDSSSEVEVVEVAPNDVSEAATLREITEVSNAKEGEDLEGVDTQRGVRALVDYPHFRFDCGKFPAKDGMLQLFCDKCFCFACDEPVTECRKWRSHRFATGEKEKWVRRRKAVLQRRKSTTL